MATLSVLAADDQRPRYEEPLGPHSTMRQVVVSVILTAATEIVTRQSELRENGDPEDVHQTRVATRRLRAQLRTLRPVLIRSWVDQVNAELKWLAAVLGQVRDADVRFEALEKHAGALPVVDLAPARALLARSLIEREEANAELLAGLHSERYRALVDQLLAAVADPPLRTDTAPMRAETAARKVLPSLVAKQWRQLRDGVADLGDDPSDEALHEVRKLAKKLRYGAETAEAVIGRRAKKLARAAKELQSVLGEVHDAAASQTWLRHQVLTSGGTSVAMAGGELIERERRRHRKYRRRWPKAWKAAHKEGRRF